MGHEKVTKFDLKGRNLALAGRFLLLFFNMIFFKYVTHVTRYMKLPIDESFPLDHKTLQISREYLHTSAKVWEKTLKKRGKFHFRG